MIKGVEVKNGNIRIFADVIEEILGCRCAALSGANIANEVRASSENGEVHDASRRLTSQSRTLTRRSPKTSSARRPSATGQTT